MPRRVDGPEITGQVFHKQTGQAYGPVTVTAAPKVYTDPEMSVSVTSLTTDGTGVFSCYAPPGQYTFTTTAVDAATIEPVEVLGHEGGTGTPQNAAYQVVLNATGYGVKADGRHLLDAAITAGTPNVTSATAAFTQADVGKVAILERAGVTLSTTLSAGLTSGANTGSLPVAALAQDWPPGVVTVTSGGNSKGFYTAGALTGATSITIVSDKPDFSYPSGATASLAPATLLTTILSVQSATQATLAANASTTLTATADPAGSGHPPAFYVVSDDTAAWALVAAAVPSGGAAQVAVPTGISYTTATIAFADRVKIVGAGGGGRRYNLSRILSSVASAGGAVTFAKSGSRFVDVTLEYVGTSAAATTGLKFTNGYYSRLVDATISGFGTLVQFVTGSEWHAERCTFHNPVTYGLDIANGDNPDEGDMSVVDCKFIIRDHAATAPVRHTSGGGMRFLNNKVNNDWRVTPSAGVWAKDMEWQYPYYAPMSAGTSDLLIENNSLENYYGSGITLTVPTGKTFTNLSVQNNEFLSFQRGANNAQAVNASAVDAGALRNVNIDGSMLNMSGGTSQGAFTITNANGVSVGPTNTNSGYPWLVSYIGCTNVGDVTMRGFGFPTTVESINGIATAAQAWTSANRAYWWRVRDGGAISQIGLNVGTSSGNVSFSIHRGAPGRNGPGPAWAVTGAIACPATGDQVVSLGGSFSVQPGDWIGMSCDNTTATFRSIAPGLGIEAWMQGLVAYKDTSHPIPAGTPAGTSFRGDRIVVLYGL